MKFGMNDQQYEILEGLVIKPLKSQGAKVFLFGSRVTGKHHPHSDVDVLFSIPKNHSLPFGLVAKIKEAIEESKFPFTVDLVAELDLAPSYVASVMGSRVEV